MIFTEAACTATVSILEAIFFGPNGACIDIGLTSLLGGVVLFIAAVVALRLLGSALLRRAIPALRRRPSELMAASSEPHPNGLDPMPYESPIKSTGAWGGKPR